MELRHLRYFVVVAEEQHFGRASKRLAIVQPALTRQIHELEREVGVNLFERVGRNVRLTNAGQLLMQDARRLLTDVDRAVQRAQLASRGQIGTLTVSFVPAMTGTPLLSTIFGEFRTAAADVKLNLRTMRSMDQWSALRERDVNVAFVYFRGADEPHGLQSHMAATEEILLAMPKGHRLEHKRTLFLHDLREEPFVWFPREKNPPFYDRIVDACDVGGLTMNIATEGPSEEMRIGLVSAGGGLSFALANAQRHKHANVLFRRVQDLNVELCVHALWRDDDPSPILPKFLCVMRTVVARLNVRHDRPAKGRKGEPTDTPPLVIR